MEMRVIFFFVATWCFSFISCNRGGAEDYTPYGGDTLTCHAQLLTIVEHPKFTIVDIADPWHEAKRLQRYILVNRNNPMPEKYPKGVVVKVPLQSSVIYSSVHADVAVEIGAAQAITGIADAQYHKTPEIVSAMDNGKIIDVGASMSPSVERIVEMSPEAIFASPYQNAGYGVIEKLGIPIIECADYMEANPLGRAEWIKLFGVLYGKQKVANEIFDNVCDNYNTLVGLTVNIKDRPMVISEMMTNGVWFVPGGRSYMAQLFQDAGADYPWRDDTSNGSLQLTFEVVYDKAHDADYWLIKTFGNDLTLDRLKADYSLHAEMKAFNRGGVYSCNTATTTLFEDFPFHPDLLLQEYINIFHPNLLPDGKLRYFKNIR